MARKTYQATAAQAAYVEALARKVSPETYERIFRDACRLNGNQGLGETVTQQVRRLTKKAASQMIGELLEATK